MAKQPSIQEQAVIGLIGAFGECIKEMFKESPVVQLDGANSNPFSKLDKNQQTQVVNSAFAKCVAQNLAGIFIMYPQMQQIEVYNQFMTMLKHETDQYHKAMLAQLEKKAAAQLSGEKSETSMG